MSVLFKLSFLLGLFLLGEVASRGTSECTFGPSYWCSSLWYARECNAVTHCIQTVWEKQILPEDNDGICNICKDMVREARDTLKSNQTQEQLKHILERSCSLIPLKEISAECIALSDEFVPQFIEMLTSQMNPQVVCAASGLCNSVHVDRLLKENGLPLSEPTTITPAVHTHEPDIKDGKDCSDCQTFVKDAVDLVKSHSKEELMDRLLSVCQELGSISDGCMSLVVNNIDVIYDFLATQINAKDTCTLFGMCGDLFGQVSFPTASEGADMTCSFCMVVAEHFRNVLISNTTEMQFKQVLEGICRQTRGFKDECLALVDSYYVAAYNFLLNEFDPKHVCDVIGVCKDILEKPLWMSLHASRGATEQPSLPRVPLSHNKLALHFVGQDESNAFHLEEAQLTDSQQQRAKLTPSIKVSVAGESGLLDGKDQLCTMCEFTLHFIQNELQDKHTRQEIEEAVKKVCSKLPLSVREQCDDYVDAYGDQVIALLEQEIDPSVMCPMLGLCPSKSSSGVVSKPFTAASFVQHHTDVTCVACEFIMVKMKEILGNRSNEEAVKNALDRVCSLLPKSMSEECQTFVNQNAIEVMQLVAAGVVPEQVCRLLGFCPQTAAPHLPSLSPGNQLPILRLFVPSLVSSPQHDTLESVGQSKTCVVCEFVVTMIQKLLLDNDTHIEDRIEGVIERVCLLMPSTLQEDCLGFIEQYGRSLLDLLINGLHPEQLCRELSLCRSPRLDLLLPSASANIVKRSIRRYPNLDENMPCLVCRAVANIYENTTSEAAVQEFCSLLPEDLAQKCSAINLEELRAALGSSQAKDTPPCSVLRQCPEANRPHLIGADRCTWGPSYWCKSLLHANSCSLSAKEFCRAKVWVSSSPPAVV